MGEIFFVEIVAVMIAHTTRAAVNVYQLPLFLLGMLSLTIHIFTMYLTLWGVMVLTIFLKKPAGIALRCPTLFEEI